MMNTLFMHLSFQPVFAGHHKPLMVLWIFVLSGGNARFSLSFFSTCLFLIIHHRGFCKLDKFTVFLQSRLKPEITRRVFDTNIQQWWEFSVITCVVNTSSAVILNIKREKQSLGTGTPDWHTCVVYWNTSFMWRTVALNDWVRTTNSFPIHCKYPLMKNFDNFPNLIHETSGF